MPFLRPVRSLYLHLPFCRHRCGYCDFNAYARLDALIPAYVDALLVELEAARALRPFAPLDTVYLGGGTPSLVSPADLARLMAGVGAGFEIAAGAEVTLEANPSSTDPERLAAWRSAGVNRLSLGVQGFDRRALATLERRTDAEQAVRAYRQARAAGFANLNLDLIFAVPFQDAASWRDTLERAVELGPEHLSCYALTFEPHTLLTRRRDQGRLPEVPADLQWELLDLATEVLAEAGFERYEVSSWARPGFRSRHNTAYWDGSPVYGAGAGAHSYASDGERAWRWWNVALPRRYIEAASAPRQDGEELDPRQAAAERLMLGLRTAAGLEPPPGFEPAVAGLQAAGLITREGARIRPTRRGMDLHNQVALAVL